MDKINFNDAFTKSFGPDMMNEQEYWNPAKELDLSKQLKIDTQAGIEKAINVGASSGAAGYAMVPLAYDQDVIDITRRYTPLLGMIPKVTNQGMTANYYRLTARASPTWGTERGALTDADDTRELASTPIKYCRIRGTVTDVGEVAGQHFYDAMQAEIAAKIQSMNEELEDVLINGDASTYPLEPNGLIKLCTSNNTNMNSTEISLADVKNTVHECYMDKGRPNLIITDAFTAGKLEQQMMDFVKYTNPTMNLGWGLEAMTINTVIGRLPIIVSQFMPTTANQRRILVVDTNMIQWRVLQDIMFQRLAKTGDEESFYLKTYRTLINKFPEGMGQIFGIA